MATEAGHINDEVSILAAKAQFGNAAALESLVVACQPLVRRVVGRRRARHADRDDLIQEGNLGLLRAVRDYSITVHCCPFQAYSITWIKAFVSRAIVANYSVVRIPMYAWKSRHLHMRDEGMCREGATGDILDYRDDGTAEANAKVIEVGLRYMSHVEAWAVRERYGLATEPSARIQSPVAQHRPDSRLNPYARSLRDMGEECGLSAARVGQIAASGLSKLKNIIGDAVAIPA